VPVAAGHKTHSPALSAADQNRPKMICAIKKADQSARIGAGSSRRVSSQL